MESALPESILKTKQYQKSEFKTDDIKSAINYLQPREGTSAVEIAFDFFYVFSTNYS